ncbi:hypothetical protein ACFFX0_16590 [Citricoccus parietis]|uniref:Uncharacterized protein n=1 Tax=Citricoccus parietis TaxID=592307 RepID=A0ABV5G1B0_9MICC
MALGVLPDRFVPLRAVAVGDHPLPVAGSRQGKTSVHPPRRYSSNRLCRHLTPWERRQPSPKATGGAPPPRLVASSALHQVRGPVRG